MSRRHGIAIGVAVVAMLLALAQPLWIRATGDEVALALRPVDPLSLFRGNYVDLNYDVDIDVPQMTARNEPIYVVFDDARPANVVRTSIEVPDLGPGETCVRGQTRGRGAVSFPALEQYFVTPDEGRQLERNLGEMVGVLKTTGSCRAVLVSIEPG